MAVGPESPVEANPRSCVDITDEQSRGTTDVTLGSESVALDALKTSSVGIGSAFKIFVTYSISERSSTGPSKRQASQSQDVTAGSHCLLTVSRNLPDNSRRRCWPGIAEKLSLNS